MSNYCPEWILGVAVGVIVGDALTGSTSILANSQKYSEGLSKHYGEVSKDFLNDTANDIIAELNEIGIDEFTARFVKSFPPDVKIFTQDVMSPNFRNPLKFILSIYMLLKGFFYSSYLLRIFKPCLVIGFGGYPTFATILAANFFRFKVVLHEGNAVLGRVNKFFSRKANIVAGGFWPTIAPSGAKLFFTGTPLRNNLLSTKTK